MLPQGALNRNFITMQKTQIFSQCKRHNFYNNTNNTIIPQHGPLIIVAQLVARVRARVQVQVWKKILLA